MTITGNRAALLQLRRQIDRALEDRDRDGTHPYEEEIYYDVYGNPFEGAVKRAKRRLEVREETRLPKPGKTAEDPPWADRARRSAEG